MNIAEKLDQIDCRKDTKARRVLNVAPDCVANITADTLEAGVTLEALEAVNVPVFRYGGQVTIHGKLPEFNPDSRPGGYKAVFRNQNGSIGVKYCAIDADKKKLIARACRMKGEFSSNATSQGFEVSQCFFVHNESERLAVKAATLAALKALPVGRFFGSAYAFSLMYGAGYGIAANIGAIPVAELWPLITELTGIGSLEELAAKEVESERQSEIQRAASHAEYEARVARERAEFETKWEAMAKALVPVAEAPVAGEVIIRNGIGFVRVELSAERGRNFYKVLEDNNGLRYGSARKLAKAFPWPKALAAGRVFQAA